MALLSAVLVGCTTETPPTGPAPGSGVPTGLPDPCSLLSPDEVASAMGIAVQGSSANTTDEYALGTGQECYYDLDGAFFVQLDVFLADDEAWAAAVAAWDEEGGVEEVAGVGTAAMALLGPEAIGTAVVAARKGDYVVLVAGTGESAQRAAVTALAATALDRLG